MQSEEEKRLGNKPSRIILLIQKNIHFDAKFGQPG
jgi:hypothetical protein